MNNKSTVFLFFLFLSCFSNLVFANDDSEGILNKEKTVKELVKKRQMELLKRMRNPGVIRSIGVFLKKKLAWIDYPASHIISSHVVCADFNDMMGLINDQKKWLREHGAINVIDDLSRE